MDAPTQETPEEFEARRRAAEDLAAAVRALADAAVGTAVDPAVVRGTADAVRALAARLGARTTDDPYADLVRRPVDPAVPQDPMPINPIIGDCSPNRPDVTLGYRDGEVHGRACLTRRFTGPPGFAHGGITAMLADQIVAVTPGAAGRRGAITKSLAVRYRRPVPIGRELTLWGVCTPDGDDMTARFTISVADDLAIEGTAVLVPFDRMRTRRGA
ncbi:MAG: PaaI family thioesterase [Actinobacteria bacterium]|nr:PaaI family thioesterase [Actinomycetota bacterium]